MAPHGIGCTPPTWIKPNLNTFLQADGHVLFRDNFERLLQIHVRITLNAYLWHTLGTHYLSRGAERFLIEPKTGLEPVTYWLQINYTANCASSASSVFVNVAHFFCSEEGTEHSPRINGFRANRITLSESQTPRRLTFVLFMWNYRIALSSQAHPIACRRNRNHTTSAVFV